MPTIDLPEVDKIDWIEWKRNPVTKRAIAGLMNQREEVKEGLAEGMYTTDRDIFVAMGRAQAIKDTVIYLIEDFDFLIKEEEVTQNA